MREYFLGQEFDFSALPSSRTEVLKIGKHFSKRDRDIYLGEKASEHTLKTLPLNNYRIIHFACHAMLDEKVPFRSALIIAPGPDNDEDGFLQVREIYGLKMDADIVVLSACQTGRGSLEKGEGFLGLPRIFFYAGTKSVVSTFWRISDRSTSVFMDVFYGHLSRGYSKTKALQLAKIKMIRSEYSHPFYWAAFSLNGDFGPISFSN